MRTILDSLATLGPLAPADSDAVAALTLARASIEDLSLAFDPLGTGA